MVMSGGGNTDSNDPNKDAEVLDWSYQNHTDGLLRGGKHCGSNFKRAILNNADLTEGDFTNCSGILDHCSFWYLGALSYGG